MPEVSKEKEKGNEREHEKAKESNPSKDVTKWKANNTKVISWCNDSHPCQVLVSAIMVI